MRGTLVALAVLAGLLTAACGGEGGSSGASPSSSSPSFGVAAPVDASQAAFCQQVAALVKSTSVEGVHDWAASMAKVGTPAGITASERAGFEKTVDYASTVKKGSGAVGAFGPPTLVGADRTNVLAFAAYAQRTCPGTVTVPSPPPAS